MNGYNHISMMIFFFYLQSVHISYKLVQALHKKRYKEWWVPREGVWWQFWRKKFYQRYVNAVKFYVCIWTKFIIRLWHVNEKKKEKEFFGFSTSKYIIMIFKTPPKKIFYLNKVYSSFATNSRSNCNDITMSVF